VKSYEIKLDKVVVLCLNEREALVPRNIHYCQLSSSKVMYEFALYCTRLVF